MAKLDLFTAVLLDWVLILLVALLLGAGMATVAQWLGRLLG